MKCNSLPPLITWLILSFCESAISDTITSLKAADEGDGIGIIYSNYLITPRVTALGGFGAALAPGIEVAI